MELKGIGHGIDKMKYNLTLFIYGPSANSDQAITNFRKLIGRFPNGLVEHRILDIQADPQIAIKYQLLATPTLIKLSPPPMIRIIGDLSDQHQVLINLGMENFCSDPESN